MLLFVLFPWSSVISSGPFPCALSFDDIIIFCGFKCHLYADGSQSYAVLVSSTSLNSRTALPTTQMDMNVSQTSQICCVLD